jgi:hypothetical protein
MNNLEIEVIGNSIALSKGYDKMVIASCEFADLMDALQRAMASYYFEVTFCDELMLSTGKAEIFVDKRDPVSCDFKYMTRISALIYSVPAPSGVVWAGYVKAFNEEHARKQIQENLANGGN